MSLAPISLASSALSQYWQSHGNSRVYSNLIRLEVATSSLLFGTWIAPTRVRNLLNELRTTGVLKISKQ